MLLKINSRTSCEDIIQACYLDFYRQLQKNDRKHFSNPKHYLLRIAKEKIAEFYRDNGNKSFEDIDEVYLDTSGTAIPKEEQRNNFELDKGQTKHICYEYTSLTSGYKSILEKFQGSLNVDESEASYRIFGYEGYQKPSRLMTRN